MNDQLRIDLPVDLNSMDETGLPWTFLDEAPHPEHIVPGAHVVVGEGSVRVVAVVVDIVSKSSGEIVHVMPIDGTLASNAHLLTSQPAS